MPYESELKRMKTERENKKIMNRVLSEHEIIANKCTEQSETAAICISKTSNEIAMAKEVPKPYIR